VNLRGFVSALLLLCSSGLGAADPDFLRDLPAYRPASSLNGTIRLWGNPYIPELVKAWEDGFRKHHPGVNFETNLKGTEAALAGLYGNIADVVLVGREAYKAETGAFEERFGYPPLELKITSGSYATPHKTFALMVYVHKDNPLKRLSFTQLDALYGAERRRGAKLPVRTWGDLGLTGEWAARPVHVYGYNFDTGMARFFRLTVLKDSYRWNPRMKDFDNGRDAKGEVINAGTYILEAVARDRDAIGFANVQFENPDVKPLALAENDAGPYVPPSPENAWRRTYPLTRYSTVFINRPPGKPVDPKVKEFLRYILSRDGMEAVVLDRAFLPLNAAAIREERGKLE
jgi:phosphate transport system substrate-binding protein